MVDIKVGHTNQLIELKLLGDIYNVMASSFSKIITLLSDIGNALIDFMKGMLMGVSPNEMEHLNLLKTTPQSFEEIGNILVESGKSFLTLSLTMKDNLKHLFTDPLKFLFKDIGGGTISVQFLKDLGSGVKSVFKNIVNLLSKKKEGVAADTTKKEEGEAGAAKPKTLGGKFKTKIKEGYVGQIFTGAGAQFGQMALLMIIIQPIMEFLQALLEPFTLLSDIFGILGQVIGLAFYPIMIQIVQAIVPFIPILVTIMTAVGELALFLFNITTPLGIVIGLLSKLDLVIDFGAVGAMISGALDIVVNWLRDLPKHIWNGIIDLFKIDPKYKV